ncbi:hypothetical protein NE619_17065 [Anaerovorax odorimutans]|uniref:Uncharacterized protein n=1 Tax=Anaerovorax odorimutans TaxID=109327 RepID=A0ABT1RTB0_9FIRM|nr:hypothetical protein [Anaerovorax odorimutans]MCQ4638443.1 hypothetical protein [Anaerovorax odorimutans]
MNGIEQLNKGLQGVFKLLAARNKELWTGRLTNAGVITVPEMDNYSVVHAVLNGGIHVTLERSESGNFVGGGILAPWSSGAQITGQICLIKSEQKYTLSNDYSSFMTHGYSTSHGEKNNFEVSTGAYIVKIIGVEPIPAKILSGGGALLKRVFAPLTGPVRGCLA